MKKFLLGLLVVGSVSIAHADDQARLERLCAGLGAAAAVTMEAHQVGVPLAKILTLSAQLSTKPLEFFDKESALQAYSMPRYSLEEHRQRAIAEFRDKRHLDCLRLIAAKD
jgi:hypothetical protein